jgi:hypothetical protein
MPSQRHEVRVLRSSEISRSLRQFDRNSRHGCLLIPRLEFAAGRPQHLDPQLVLALVLAHVVVSVRTRLSSLITW